MSLLYKPDWEKTMENYKAWWAGEDFGRCAIRVTARKAGTEHMQPPKKPDKIEDRWLDHEYLHAKNEYEMQTTFYGGEAFPIWSAGHPGWAGCKAMIGVPVELRETTGWAKPIIAEGDLRDYDYRKFVPDFSSDLWKRIEAMHRFAVEESKGKCIPYVSAIGHTGDTLEALRSGYQLLLDLVDDPEYVHEFEMHLIENVWQPIYNRLYDIVKDGSFGGSSTWMGIWGPGKTFNPSNDFTYMISTDMYREIYLDALKRHMEMLEYSIYHVDGIEAFRHVDMLIEELPTLQGLQILPGDGKPSPLHFMDVLKKVQAGGKNLHISIPPHEVKDALENLSSKGLYISTWAHTEEEAKELIRYAEKNSRYY